MRHVIGAHVQGVGNHLQGQGLPEIRVNIALDPVSQNRLLLFRLDQGTVLMLGDCQSHRKKREHQSVRIGCRTGELAGQQLKHDPAQAVHLFKKDIRPEYASLIRGEQGVFGKPRHSQSPDCDTPGFHLRAFRGDFIVDDARVINQEISLFDGVLPVVDQITAFSLRDQDDLRIIIVRVHDPGMPAGVQPLPADIKKAGDIIPGENLLCVMLHKALYLKLPVSLFRHRTVPF